MRTRKANTRTVSSPVLHRTTILCNERDVTASPGLPKSSQRHPWTWLKSSPSSEPVPTRPAVLPEADPGVGGMLEGSHMHLSTPMGYAHLEQHAALLGEGQEVGHGAADVLQDGRRHRRLCHAGHELGEQEVSAAKPTTWRHREGPDPTAHGQALVTQQRPLPRGHHTCMTELR